MFWGLIVEPGKRFTQTAQKSFHISQAALDLESTDNEPVQVLLGFEKRTYLLCTLNKKQWVQAPLDLNFKAGDTVSFATNGPGYVHLTGYLIDDDDFDVSDLEETKVEDVSENKKRKIGASSDKQQNKKQKVESLTARLLDEIGDETDDPEDSDVNLTDLIESEAEEEEEDDEADDVEEEEDDDNDEDDDEIEDEEDDDEEQEEDEKQSNSSPNIKKQKNKKQEQKPKTNGFIKEKDNKSPVEQSNDKSKPQKKTLSGGVIIEDIKVGQGPTATHGRQVQVYYEGRLQSNNKVFDSSKKGIGFRFRLGKQEVIKGWDVGLPGMKVGGKRRIICPPNMAYGAHGSPPVIPPNSTLIFEVELKNVK